MSRMKNESVKPRSKGSRQGVAIGISLMAVALLMLYAGSPASENWPLKCPLYQFTGWQCPLCGSQRAIHEMMHGNIIDAWRYNPALWLALPYFGVWAAGVVMPSWEEYQIVRWARQDRVLVVVVVALLLWGVVRNL